MYFILLSILIKISNLYSVIALCLAVYTEHFI